MKTNLPLALITSFALSTIAHSAVLLSENFEGTAAPAFGLLNITTSGFAGDGTGTTIVEDSDVATAFNPDYIARIDYADSHRANTSDALIAIAADNLGLTHFGFGDIDGTTNGNIDLVALSFEDINIAGFGTNYSFSAFFGEIDDGTDNDFDAADSVGVFASVDGSAFVQIFGLESSGPFDTQFFVDTNLNGNGDGVEITNTLTQFSVDNIGDITGLTAGSLLNIQIRVNGLDSGNEDIAIDNILIEGTAIPEPSSTLLVGLGGLTLLARRKR